MRTILCVLCVAMCSGAASAREQISNFDRCVSESKVKHTESVMANYLSYKCDGAIAQRLAARPDQCAMDVRPSLRRIVRKSRQLQDGLYLRMIWSTDRCAGMCETRSYDDSRATSYLCEVRRHTVGRVAHSGNQPTRRPGFMHYISERPTGRRHADQAPSVGRRAYPARGYDQPATYGRLTPQTTEFPREPGPWIDDEPGRPYLEYGHSPADYPDDYRHGGYDRWDDRSDYR